ncbi:hypothetical protein [Jannaschia formosa]|uniref:hypothetical protein n=1 Tax=Jannaschia formosa TaxID=2259592 RepID=UPI000E1BB2E4|nr:hypothetical protein [Jannaschia formosa]TFL18904.1 hypothetical protein DR046_08300 [Jannaschia formosa]
MLRKNLHIALLGSAAAVVIGTAHAQTSTPPDGNLDPEACANLAERLTNNEDIDAEVRAEIETIIAEGDVAQCGLIFTAWEREGVVTAETLEVVATASVSERMIVQQEVEVDAAAAVYQPPAEVGVVAGAPEVTWSMPRQSVTVEEQAPQVVIRQGRPSVNVEVPQPRIMVNVPEPEVIITWPDSAVELSAIEPNIQVRMPEPTVTVNMPEPIVEVMIGGQQPAGLVELEDGRYAPPGTTLADLDPQISITQQEAMVSQGTAAEDPEIIFNRGAPEVTFEAQEPEVSVNVLGEPEVQVTVGQGSAERNVTIQDASD